MQPEISTTINDLAVHAAGPPVRVEGGTARVLSDPPDNPLAYHLFSAYMLERVHDALPAAFGPSALQLRAEAGRYALALMAPDGDLAYAGRSDQESWVLAAAAALGARRAAEAGPDAAQWRTFADRALDRLWREHSLLGDGTIPIVPGLRFTWNASMLDAYAQMAQYNGLTVWLLADAAAHWPAADAPRAPLPADRPMLVDDLRGTGLVWGRVRDLWWAVSGRRSGAGARYDQGIVAVKPITRSGPVDVVAARPRSGHPSGAWTLKTPRGRARFIARTVSGRAARATLRGTWHLQSGRTWRPATWTITARVGQARRHNRPAAARAPRRGGVDDERRAEDLRPRRDRCPERARTPSASGLACPHVTAWHRRGRAILQVAD